MPDDCDSPFWEPTIFMCTYRFVWELEGSHESPQRCWLHPSFGAQGRHSVSGAEDIALTPLSGIFQRGLFLYEFASWLFCRIRPCFYKAFSIFGFCDPILSFLSYLLPENSSSTCGILQSHFTTLVRPSSLYYNLWIGLSKSSLSFLIHFTTSRSKGLIMSILKTSNTPQSWSNPRSTAWSLKWPRIWPHLPFTLRIMSSPRQASIGQRHSLTVQPVFFCSFPFSSASLSLNSLFSRLMFFPFLLQFTFQILSFLPDPS